MCGIVGYIGNKEIIKVLLDGIKRLEYRGYDSSGIAVIENGTLRCEKAVGKIAELEKEAQRKQYPRKHGNRTYPMGNPRCPYD